MKSAVDAVLAEARADARRGEPPPPALELATRVVAQLRREETRTLVPVLNGTGVLLHTNLGRAPLAVAALAAVESVGREYSNLEFDLDAGERGSRYDRVGTLLREWTGAEDALVVNNNAAAILLVLDTFAKGREVVVARNGLIEIGGGFRLPDVLARSGAHLVEVGATNKVYLSDVRRALGPRTSLLLRSHASNFRIEGFVADVEPRELAALGTQTRIPTLEDLGSGALIDLREYGLPHERTVREAVADGMTLVAFSGDKLLGGPQAGIIAGTRVAIARLRANPLLRALRVDKATIAALAATLALYADRASRETIPFYRMLAATLKGLRERAERIASATRGHLDVRIVESTGRVGGGALPEAAIPSIALALHQPGTNANALAARLRRARPPLVGRVDGNDVLIDLRTISPLHDDDVAHAIGP